MAQGFGDMSSLLKQAQQMQKRMADMERDLQERILEGTSGGGAVRVFINGSQEIQGVKISKDAVDPDDVETLEDLVMTAVRQAVSAARDLRQREMNKVTGGLNLPGMGF
jgi:DNA-binding YbaB/EbfC family protein